MAVTITADSSRVKLACPYHPTLPAKAKAIGGRFCGEDKTWVFDARDEQRVRDLARSIYGTDGSAPAELVTVRLDLDKVSYSDSLWIFGREIARRAGRDLPVRLGDGVILIAGGFSRSGGSRANPDIKAQDGTVLEVRDVPKVLVDPDRGGVTIVDLSISREALQAERASLLARLAEIEGLLTTG